MVLLRILRNKRQGMDTVSMQQRQRRLRVVRLEIDNLSFTANVGPEWRPAREKNGQRYVYVLRSRALASSRITSDVNIIAGDILDGAALLDCRS